MTAELDLIMDNAIDLAGVAASAPEAPVPQYPQWRLTDLIAHTGSVHRRTVEVARTLTREPLDRHPAPELPPDELVDWFVAGAHEMVEALDDAPAWVSVWGFGPSPTIGSWRLRMALETSVHRVDAERAVGDDTGLDPDLAAAGVDEFGFMWLGGLPVPDGAAGDLIELEADDVAVRWTIDAGERMQVVRRSGEAPATVSGPASDLYLWLINRRPLTSLAVSGDRSLLDGVAGALGAQSSPRR